MVIGGRLLGHSVPLDGGEVVVGRDADAHVVLSERTIARHHAKVRALGAGAPKSDGLQFEIVDLGAVSGTFVNDERLTSATTLREGDRIRIGSTLLKFVYQDEVEEKYQQFVREARAHAPHVRPPVVRAPWTVDSWRDRPIQQSVDYGEPSAIAAATAKLQRLPPIVTSWEIENLKSLIADAQEGKRFLLQGGDCAETVHDCESGIITNKLKILLQMSLVLTYGTRRPIIRVGRFAGQYAKPRSSPTEVRNGVELPSYFGDLVNRVEFTAEARRPNPANMVDAYLHAASTMNFIRALGGGNSDLRRPEYFDLSFFERGAALSSKLRDEYQKVCQDITHGLHFASVVGDRESDELMKTNVFASHEGLNLLYEAAQTRRVPRRSGYFDLTTHLPWIGERTRSLDGAHVEFFRGIENPIAIKLGPKVAPDDVVALTETLNPSNEPGKIVLITRMGVANVAKLGPIIEAVQESGARVLWVSDPMHGNAILSPDGIKTRDFDDILKEVEGVMRVHEECGTYFGGVHFEFTGEDVTECVGGGLTHADLDRAYTTACDPRLNYRQALEMAFAIAHRLAPDAHAKPGL